MIAGRLEKFSTADKVVNGKKTKQRTAALLSGYTVLTYICKYATVGNICLIHQPLAALFALSHTTFYVSLLHSLLTAAAGTVSYLMSLFVLWFFFACFFGFHQLSYFSFLGDTRRRITVLHKPTWMKSLLGAWWHEQSIPGFHCRETSFFLALGIHFQGIRR